MASCFLKGICRLLISTAFVILSRVGCLGVTGVFTAGLCCFKRKYQQRGFINRHEKTSLIKRRWLVVRSWTVLCIAFNFRTSCARRKCSLTHLIILRVLDASAICHYAPTSPRGVGLGIVGETERHRFFDCPRNAGKVIPQRARHYTACPVVQEFWQCWMKKFRLAIPWVEKTCMCMGRLI